MEKVQKRFNILAIVCIIFFAIAISPKELQNDTFYTIKIGEYISENGIGNLTEDPFSWHDLSYTFPHWLYDYFIYNIYSLSGMDGLYFSTIFFTFILGISIFFVANKKSQNSVLSFLITLLALFVIKPYIAVRAQLVTFTLFVWTAYFIEKFLDSRKYKYGIFLFIISVLIANIHLAVWPMFFVLFCPYIGEYVVAVDWFNIDLKIIWYKFFDKKNKDKIKELREIEKENSEKRKKIRKNPYKIKMSKNDNIFPLLFIFFISILGGLLTPTGFTPFTYLYKTLQGNTTTVINEHLPLTLVSAPEFAFSLIAFLAVLIFTDSKIRLSDFFFFAGLTYLSLRSRRQISMFVIICYPIFARLMSELFNKHDKKFNERSLKFFTNYFVVLGILGVVSISAIFMYRPQVNAEYVNEELYPVQASKWIKENLDLSRIRLFNEYNYGSYLLYQGIPVMIDSRADLYAPEFNTKTGDPKDGIDIFMDVQNTVTLATDYVKIFKKYDISHIILTKNSKLASLLQKDSDYKELYKDDYFIIFENKKIIWIDTVELE